MESARALVQRPLPRLEKMNGRTNPSISSSESISARFLFEWSGFTEEVLSLSSSLNLEIQVPLTEDSDAQERFVVGSELGLTGRFSKHVCDAVAKVLSITELSHLTFGDYQATDPTNSDNVPDVVTLGLPNAELVAVGELKTFWTVRLEDCPISEGQGGLVPMQPHFGQLIAYMRANNRKYGFLSTYRSTVFVRRTEDFRFELSLPINERATNPSLRECFLAFCFLSWKDGKYIEPVDFNPSRLKVPLEPFMLQALTRPSPLRNQIEAKADTPGESIGSQSILFGGEDGIAQHWVNCKRLVHGSRHKAVYEVIWDGRPAIAKCWSKSLYERYVHEVSTYERLYQSKPEGFDVFATLLSHGKIVCSSLFPVGYILVITKVSGEPLNTQWDLLSQNHKHFIRQEIQKAVQILRTFNILSVDAGKHNVLYEPKTQTVTMVDFELMQTCWDEMMRRNSDFPEMWAIFGERQASESCRHQGG